LADAIDIGVTIHPNPTPGDSIGMAAEVAHGSCTDVLPQKRSSSDAADFTIYSIAGRAGPDWAARFFLV
jgi:hypothetical protein